MDQISTIFSILGTPSVSLMYEFTKRSNRLDYNFEPTSGIGLDTLIPDAPEDFKNLLKKMLELDPKERIDIKEALNHPFFYSLTELKKYRKSLISRIS